MSSSSSDGGATPRALSPQPGAHSEIAEAVYEAVNRQLARDGGNAPERMAAAAAVAVIIEATRPDSSADTQSRKPISPLTQYFIELTYADTNATAGGSASPPAQAAVDAGPFASLSYEECLDFLVSLAKIAHAKEMELHSDEMLSEDGDFPESKFVPGGDEHET
ncbi:hypothetical protein PoHVEF18_004920 [Penicillium ochrochloron]